MEWIFSLSTTIVIFIAAIFILVTIHELGHFIAAKFFNMRVDKFSIGFPPKIFGFKKGETEYVLGATPLGGYVSIAGMIDESMDDEFMNEEPKDDEFRSKPVWQRMIVITAGVIFNVILAVFIYAGIAFSYGEDVIPIEAVGGIYVVEESVAYEVGFRTGDQIIGINGERVEYFNEIFNPAAITGRDLSFMIVRDGEVENLFTPPNFLDRIGQDGFLNQSNALPSHISMVLEDSPAHKAGLQDGDEVVAVDGEEIGYWVQLVEKIQNSESALSLTVLRNGEQHTIEVAADPETNMIGIAPPNPREIFDVRTINYNLAESFGQGLKKSEDTFFGIIQGIGMMFSGDISVRQNLGGPVAIANVTKEATDSRGFLGFWEITAFLSITLAIMNMLPIPALDGGHFMFLLYEGITRREPSPKVRMGLQQIGFLFLIGLIILVTFNDILRTFGG
ncbi:RIP metalloprotease RseP [Rhodohalobacter sp. SW132]|uniref:RIP metalloprotease RseP n=1 Tax=Rhodohalobacter sp. SW132 TaxID=2293433 RepID=UPI000E277BEC|nr:RIP metalloprotease RseP [Rhodohalobacter sp. SW132]REL38205.1 RIP metalloprotease RseP [Rhodohalobacter sp. SW132]